MSLRPLIGLLAAPVFLTGTPARADDLECTRYVPEIGRTVHVRCADAVPPTAAAVPENGRPERVTLGLTLAPLTPELRDKYRVAKSIDGVLVTDVDTKSEAAGRGIKRGDVIMQTNQGVVTTPDDVVRIINEATASGRRSILLLLKNAGGEVAFVALPLG
jgi:S1-C subfamily serine protease